MFYLKTQSVLYPHPFDQQINTDLLAGNITHIKDSILSETQKKKKDICYIFN